jgi:hypothetical protein
VLFERWSVMLGLSRMPWRSLLAAAAVALFLAPTGFLNPVSASTLEEASEHFVSYQFDAGSHHDAPDGCSDADPEWAAGIGTSTDGMLVAPDDASDVFLVDVPPALRGKRMHVALTEATDVDSLELTAFMPGCTGSVLDLVNWPTPEPSPPQPAAGETQHSADVSGPLHCDSDHWVFYLDELHSVVEPASIYLAWTDGSEASVDLDGRWGNYALYETDQHLGVLLKGAWANLADAWTGDFGFWLGPCDAVDGGAVYGAPPVVGMGFLDFTPTKAGPHVVQVTFNGAAGDVIRPVPAPVSVDVDSYLPITGDDLPADPTGTLHGFGHSHDDGGDASGSASPGADPSVSAIPTIPAIPRLPTLALPKVPSARDATQVPSSVAMPGPVVMPMTCHWCVGDLEGVWDMIAYRVAVVSS